MCVCLTVCLSLQLSLYLYFYKSVHFCLNPLPLHHPEEDMQSQIVRIISDFQPTKNQTKISLKSCLYSFEKVTFSLSLPFNFCLCICNSLQKSWISPLYSAVSISLKGWDPVPIHIIPLVGAWTWKLYLNKKKEVL